MERSTTRLSPSNGARIAGASFLLSFFLAIYVGNAVLPNFINPGDTTELANAISNDKRAFHIAVVGYLVILALDVAVALGLYLVLKPANAILASLSGSLRLLYVVVMVFSVLALVGQFIDIYDYGSAKLLAYGFFTGHIVVTGLAVFKSGYLPRVLGILLMLASFSYVFAFYLSFLVPEAMLVVLMLFMIAGELPLSLWLLFRAAKIPT